MESQEVEMGKRRNFRSTPIEPEGFVCVVVFKYPSPTNPVIVNAYYHPDKPDAEAHKRQIIRDAKRDHIDMSRLTVRVKPLWRFKD